MRRLAVLIPQPCACGCWATDCFCSCPACIPMLALPSVRRPKLRRRGLRLEYLTIAWNAVEAVVAVAAGLAAGSIALVGFGLDSLVEVFAAGVVVWELKGIPAERERRALRAIALSFFALAAYVIAESVRDLLTGSEPAESPLGIALSVASLVVMPLLAVAKRRTGRALDSSTLVADSSETWLCAHLSAILLAGLVINATLGWWWADPIAALGIAGLAVREGWEAWRGRSCCWREGRGSSNVTDRTGSGTVGVVRGPGT